TAIRPTQQATSTIPIVMGYSTDPVGSGFVASLARPGGNVTGLASSLDDIVPKQIETPGERGARSCAGRPADESRQLEYASSPQERADHRRAGSLSIEAGALDRWVSSWGADRHYGAGDGAVALRAA